MRSSDKSDQFPDQNPLMGRYKVYDTYFYESHFLVNKFNGKTIEFSVDDYFDEKKLVNLRLFSEKLEEAGLGSTNIYRQETTYNKKESRYSIEWYFFMMDEKAIMLISHDLVKNLDEVLFKPRSIMATESVGISELKRVFEIAEECLVDTEADTKRYINIVISLPREGLRLNKHAIRQPEIPDLDLYYGQGFKEKHNKYLQLVQEKDHSGLFIFHGPTGGGKTNYIRYLIASSKLETNFIFYPVTLLKDISSPELIAFITHYKNAILVIEESEDSVKSREALAADRASIANLLNVSDGLLSDVLNLKIICTFNTDIRNLDDALLREGRLLGVHNFPKVSPERANKIAAINKINRTFEEDVSLAQIFNEPLDRLSSDFHPEKHKIGF